MFFANCVKFWHSSGPLLQIAIFSNILHGNHVGNMSKKLFEQGPWYLIYCLGMRWRLPDYYFWINSIKYWQELWPLVFYYGPWYFFVISKPILARALIFSLLKRWRDLDYSLSFRQILWNFNRVLALSWGQAYVWGIVFHKHWLVIVCFLQRSFFREC